MKDQMTFNEIEDSIRSELDQILESKLKLSRLFENMPKEFSQKLHDNYLGIGPTRAVLSSHFHESLNEEDRSDLLKILRQNFVVETE